MEMIKYNENKTVAFFDGYKFRKDLKTGYFLSSKKTDLNKRERLHCYVWRFFHGSIPEGYHIHHKDEDKDNNELQNLICIPESEHIRLHSRENAAKNKNSIKQNLKENALPSAIAWHKSEAGKLWHSAHQRQTIENLEPKKYICKYCGKVFYKLPLGGTKFCSNNCKAAYRRKTGADNEKRICAVCGREFYVNKYAETKTCSKKCATALRWDKVNHPHRETTGL